MNGRWYEMDNEESYRAVHVTCSCRIRTSQYRHRLYRVQSWVSLQSMHAHRSRPCRPYVNINVYIPELAGDHSVIHWRHIDAHHALHRHSINTAQNLHNLLLGHWPNLRKNLYNTSAMCSRLQWVRIYQLLTYKTVLSIKVQACSG